MRRMLTTLTMAIMIAAALSACALLPQNSQESGNGMSGSIDTVALGEAITATSPNIESTVIDVTLDGFNHALFVGPVITSAGLTSSELDAILRVAYTKSLGSVQSIEIRTEDVNEKAVDVKAAAIELGIHYLPLVNSVSYSTEFLKKAYDE